MTDPELSLNMYSQWLLDCRTRGVAPLTHTSGVIGTEILLASPHEVQVVATAALVDIISLVVPAARGFVLLSSDLQKAPSVTSL